MSQDNEKNEAAAALWREARAAWSGSRDEAENGTGGDTPLDPMVLAAYLDGRLEGREREALEARLAADEGLLDEMLALRQLEPEAAPTNLILRAQGLVRETPRAAAAAPRRAWFAGLLQPLGWAGTAAALALVCALSFELGRDGVAAAGALEQLAAAVETPFEASAEFPL